MQELINRCIDEINSNSKRENGGYDEQTPKNPSIIVNYNLKDGMRAYCNYLEQLWPSVYRNIPRTERDGDIAGVENRVRSKNLFSSFGQIHIHVLVNLTECEYSVFTAYIKEHFSNPEYKVILHEFLDYEDKDKAEETEGKLLKLMKEESGNTFQFIYSNMLFNGGLWLGDDEQKLLRLAANITAIMSIDSHYFNNSRIYTFSYNLLAKPVKKMVLVTIHRLLTRLCSCEDGQELDQYIGKRYRGVILGKSAISSKDYLFTENDFQYLPNNVELKKERAKTKKSLEALEKIAPLAAACVRAMIRQKRDSMADFRVDSSMFLSNINEDHKISFYTINGFLQENHSETELVSNLENNVLYDRNVIDEGSYGIVLREYANQKVSYEVTRQLLLLYKKHLMKKVERAKKQFEYLLTCLDRTILDRNRNDNDSFEYYEKLVDNYWDANKDDIIRWIDQCEPSKESMREGLFYVLRQLFNKVPIYYKSFEDEIDERLGNNMARSMFEMISKQETVEKNICINWQKLQFSVDLRTTNEAVLLINPESQILKKGIGEKYDTLRLSRQDCVERIDFHILSLKENNG